MGGRGSRGRPDRNRTEQAIQAELGLQPSEPTEQVDQPDPHLPVEKAPEPVDPATAAVNRRWERVLREVLTDLTREEGDWAALVDIRRALDARGVSREAQDAHLKRLSKERKLTIAPESNRKMLNDADHAASIRIGNEENNIVMWEPTRRPPDQP